MSKSSRALSVARRKLHLGQVKKQLVFAAAAEAMGRALPTNTRDGYALLREFTNTPGGVAPKKSRVTPHEPHPHKKKKQKQLAAVATDGFLSTYEWRRLRMEVIKERGSRCECCGATPADGQTVINVDHIKPRRKYPELALTKANLQVLCSPCNHGKGNWDETDWREQAVRAENSEFEPLWAPYIARETKQ